ncbi:hypothetical protein V1514DRAFT_368211 [Lipomyces japonicus]|uniref:uncharacterized protein n=1 Tax=Lipomyces japonicus TaxID=56871 RepID=UPI0034CDD5CB
MSTASSPAAGPSSQNSGDRDDSFDKRILDLRTRLTSDPYYNPQFKEEYVTYLSSKSSSNNTPTKDVDSKAATMEKDFKDEDDFDTRSISSGEYVPEEINGSRSLGYDDELQAPSMRPNGQSERKLKLETQTKQSNKLSHNSKIQTSNRREDDTRSKDMQQRVGTRDRDKPKDLITASSDRLRDRSETLTSDNNKLDKLRDLKGNNEKKHGRNRDQTKETANRRQSDENKRDLNRSQRFYSKHGDESSKLRATASDKISDDTTKVKVAKNRYGEGASSPTSRTLNSAQKQIESKKDISKQKKSTSRADVDYYPLTPLPQMLSPSIPSIFDTQMNGDDIFELDNGRLPDIMLSPTLPKYFESDPKSGSTDQRNYTNNKLKDPLPIKKNDFSTRIITLKIRPSKLEALLKGSDAVKKRKQQVDALPVDKVKIKKAKSNGLSQALVPTLPSKLDINNKASRTPTSFPDRSFRSPTKTVLERATVTPPPSQALAMLEAAGTPTTPTTPGTASTKKSTLAEYKKRKVNNDDGATPVPQLETDGKGKSELATEPATKIQRSNGVSGQSGPNDVKVLESKVQRWISVATDRKHESDRLKESGNVCLAGLYATDALIAYLVGFHYDDICAVRKNRSPSVKNWSTLIPFTRHVVNLHLASKCSELAGLAYEIRAIVYLRIVGLQQQAVKALQNQSQSESAPSEATSTNGTASTTAYVSFHVEVTEQLNRISKNIDLASFDFQRGSRFLSIDNLITKFPKTWSRRSPAENLSTTTAVVLGGSRAGPGLRPIDDQFVLPIHLYSTIREVAAFAASILREHADNNSIEFKSLFSKGISD